MKTTIRHRFEDHQINLDTEVLLVGTFNPEVADNPAQFFYSRGRNYLWRLLPIALGQPDLKEQDSAQKQHFITNKKFDFIDLITSVEVDEGEKSNYSDAYLDRHVKEWTAIEATLERLSQVKKVFLTRKTFADVPNIRKKVELLSKYCSNNQIEFDCLPTPARFYNSHKQQIWSEAFAL